MTDEQKLYELLKDFDPAVGDRMGKNIDKTYIQMKMLNTGKGPAVRALRAQADKALYAMTMKHTVERQENLTLRQSMVDEILVEDERGECSCFFNTNLLLRNVRPDENIIRSSQSII